MSSLRYPVGRPPGLPASDLWPCGRCGAEVVASGAHACIIGSVGRGGVGARFTVTDPIFGAVGDGVTDDTQAALDCLDAAAQVGSVAVFPPGFNFLITQTLPVAVTASVDATGAVVTAGASMVSMLEVGTSSAWWEGRWITGGRWNAANLASGFAKVWAGLHSEINSLSYIDTTGDGILLGDPTAFAACHELHIRQVKGDRTASAAVPAGSRGTRLVRAADSVISDCIMVGYDQSFRVENGSGGNTFIACHGWGYGTDSAKWPSTVFYEDASDNQYIACYADTPSQYGWWMGPNAYRWEILGGRVYNNANGLDNTVVGVHLNTPGGDPNDGAIIGLKVTGANSSHRIATDYDGYVGSSRLRVSGCQCFYVVTPSLRIDNAASLNTTRLRLTGSSPSVGAGAALGTSPPAPSVRANSRDQGGVVLAGTGSSTSAGLLCTITFSLAYGIAPVVTLSPGDAATAALGLYVGAVTTTTAEVWCTTAPTAGLAAGSLIINYACAAPA